MQEFSFLLIVVRNLFSSPRAHAEDPAPLNLHRLRTGQGTPGQATGCPGTLPIR